MLEINYKYPPTTLKCGSGQDEKLMINFMWPNNHCVASEASYYNIVFLLQEPATCFGHVLAAMTLYTSPNPIELRKLTLHGQQLLKLT